MAKFINWGGLAPWRPVDNVQPFTNRDGETYLSLLHRLRSKVVEILYHLDEMGLADQSIIDRYDKALAMLAGSWNAAFTELNTNVVNWVFGRYSAGATWDPTDGSQIKTVERVISRVYDNIRIYAYFARELDELDRTAGDWDAMEIPARLFDLGLTYPDPHFILPERTN